jgi:hypothetical protein
MQIPRGRKKKISVSIQAAEEGGNPVFRIAARPGAEEKPAGLPPPVKPSKHLQT